MFLCFDHMRAHSVNACASELPPDVHTISTHSGVAHDFRMWDSAAKQSSNALHIGRKGGYKSLSTDMASMFAIANRTMETLS